MTLRREVHVRLAGGFRDWACVDFGVVVVINPIARVICIASALTACARAQTPPAAQDVPRGVTIPQNATDIKVRRQGNAADVVYKIRCPFPATEFLQEVNRSLSNAGFAPMAMDWLNPTVPSSHLRGWTPFIDGTVTPNV